MLVLVLVRSKDALIVMVFFVLLAMVLFGSMVYLAEGGDWMVTADFPEGAYLRRTANQRDWEVSPFLSIGSSFWWVMVTVTTVGYGDLFPTSPGGKFIGAVTVIIGILTLALPITIISTNYSSEVAAQQASEDLRAAERQNAQRRREVFGKKYDGEIKKIREKVGDPVRLLTALSEASHPWAGLGFIEGEVKAFVALQLPKEHREDILDKFFFQTLALLKMQSPVSPAERSRIRQELIAFYAAFG